MFKHKKIAALKSKITDLLKQGISPGKLALAVTLGLMVGLFPVLASTTALCLFLGWAFKLNHVVLQAVNQAVYPLQLALWLPQIELGKWLLGAQKFSVTREMVFNRSQWGNPAFYRDVVLQQTYGILVWSLLFLPVFWTLYPALKKTFGYWGRVKT